MQLSIEEKYSILAEKLDIKNDNVNRKINQIIRKSLHEFCNSCNNPAIWCMGKHTTMLMADFMNEMKRVHCIIDNNKKNIRNMGFTIIGSDELSLHQIDGVIISSYLYRNEIKEELKSKTNIKYLDIYEKLETEGIILRSSYFSYSHPYSRYKVINQLQIDYENTSKSEKEALLRKIIKEYIIIKDFKTALKYIEILVVKYKKSEDKKLNKMVREIYDMQLQQMSKISKENIVLFCMDGLRRQDLLNNKLPDLLNWVTENTYFYANAYSSSTSTYESLIPVYSENNNMKTQYFNDCEIPVQKCRFVSEALTDNKKVYFYTDSDNFVKCDEIIRSGNSQTATEKMWDFMIDASNCSIGLFYIHVLYESHYSYPNPYTKNKIVADGSNMMFDFLTTKGGKLRTDYVQQQADALRYLNDVLTPFLNVLNCSMVLYADHGNLLMHSDEKIEQLDETKYTFHNDLIQVPIAVKSPLMKVGVNSDLISLMELNSIIDSLMKRQEYHYMVKDHIKVQRSTIYNPDFRYLYKKYGHTKCLLAFELFIFENDCRLAIYEDGSTEFFNAVAEENCKKNEYLAKVKDEITVCDVAKIQS